jgi:predicted glycogen debranching enzyme
VSVIDVGREICNDLTLAENREWLVTNGIGGYACGTIAGLLTRRYHGLLMAALDPPQVRTLLLGKLDESTVYDDRFYPLNTNRWHDGAVDPLGYRQTERFYLEGSIPVWHFACADALLEKRVWMQQGSNTTYIRYTLRRATQPLKLKLRALVNYRGFHEITRSRGWQMALKTVDYGVQVQAFPGAVPLYLLGQKDSGDPLEATPSHIWYYGFDLVKERDRGLDAEEDHLHAATFQGTLNPGESLTMVASIEAQPRLMGEAALESQHAFETQLRHWWQAVQPEARHSPPWIQQLVQAAAQFIVDRPLPNHPDGKTILAGYPWFGDWGRDTMISLPGLTLATGRPEIARTILQTYSQSVDQGMLPNQFPDGGDAPGYNTVDASLWYFDALRAYYRCTQDQDLIEHLYPVLADILEWHCRGTRYGIHRDPEDGLLYAGESGTQLTWMDAKVGDWAITPRIGKAVEINALWINALWTMAKFAHRLGKPFQEYESLAQQATAGFARFWNPAAGYCFDVLDGPEGNDPSLRPNQILAISLPESPLSPAQQRSVVDICGRSLLTSYGLRTLAPDHPRYAGVYDGDPRQRDSVYHQGTVWGWLLGPFALAHLRVYGDPEQAKTFLRPMANHLADYGVGSLGEIFDGDLPLHPRGCFAQAWTVAEVLRAWLEIEESMAYENPMQSLGASSKM